MSDYIHKETGNAYEALFLAKGKVNGEWVLGVVYRDGDGIYWREYEDFHQKFEEA